MSYWQKINPSGAVSEFVSVFRDAGPKRWPIAALSALLTVGILSVMTWESWRIPRALPEITYITTFPEDWTPAESKAFRDSNQKLKEQRAAAEAQYEAEGRKLWESLGRASGMDVDAIKKKAEAERVAAAAAEAAKADALLKQAGAEPVAK
jgi:hypothetical protein